MKKSIQKMKRDRIPWKKRSTGYKAVTALLLVCFAAGISITYLPFFKWMESFAACPFHAATGFYCPGCGGTRAVSALFQGRIASSVLYHPVVVYAAACLLAYYVTETAYYHGIRTHKATWDNRLIWIGLAILGIQWLLKNLLHII